MRYKDEEFLIDEYLTKNKSASQIAKENSVHSSSIYRYLKKFNIKKDSSIIQRNRVENQVRALEGKYGVSNPILIPGVKDRVKATNLERYGSSTYLNSREGMERSRKLSLDKYGTEHPMQSEEVRKQFKDIMLERHGVESPLQKKEFLEKYKNTMSERHGSDGVLSSPKLRNQFELKMMELYGAKSIAQTKSGKEKILKSKIQSGHIKLIDKTLKGKWAEENKIPYTTVTYLTRKFGLTSEELISKKVSGSSNIERAFASKTNFNLYNKFFNLEEYPDLRYRPDFKLTKYSALNVDGLYWHSELNKDKYYHFNMRKAYEDSNLKIFQFREDEVNSKMDIISSMINNHLKAKTVSIGARKTVLEEVSHKESLDFFNKNHLKGGKPASKHYALKYKGEIIFMVSVILKKNVLKIDRMASKLGYNIQGGWGKCFSKIKQDYVNTAEYHYWVDLRYGSGNFLTNFNFSKVRDILGWNWTDRVSTYNRLKCRANMDKRFLTEKEHAAELNFVKIYDAGQRLWVFKNEAANEG